MTVASQESGRARMWRASSLAGQDWQARAVASRESNEARLWLDRSLA